MVANKKSGSPRVKGKHAVAEKKTPAKSHTVAQPTATVTIDRRESREHRSAGDRRTQNLHPTVDHRVLQRRVKVNRRRQIDPTTCERDYTPDEIEFMGAMDEYKRRNGRMFPTCSEVLEVIKALGYEKHRATEPTPLPNIELPIATNNNAVVVA